MTYMGIFNKRVRGVLLAIGMFGLTSVAPTWAAVDIPRSGGFEPHNATVNPQNPSQFAVMQGCTVRVTNDFGQNFVTWTSTVPSTNCGGDPSMGFDSQGNLYVTHLIRNPEQGVMAAQIPNNILMNGGTYTPQAVSNNGDGVGADKQWLAVDANPQSPFRDNVYLVWTEFFAPWQIMFSRSTNQGVNWSTPVALTPADNDGDGVVDEDALDGLDNDFDGLIDEDPPEGDKWPSHVAVGANGDVYIAYHTNTCDTGNTLATEATTILLRDGTGGAQLAAGTVEQVSMPFGPGQATVTCNRQDDATDPSLGDTIPGTDFWLIGTMQPWILPDPTAANKVYVIGNDDPNDAYASGDDADVVIARSDDFGLTFTRGRVDHDPGQSFAIMPTAHIDQDGNIAVAWYTNRRMLTNTGALSNDGNPNFLLDLYGTTSSDGGVTFTNDFRINDAPFDPDVNKNLAMNRGCKYGSFTNVPPDCTARIGEYNGIWTVDGIGYATWTGNGTPPTPPFPADGGNGMIAYLDLFSMAGAFPDPLEPNESRDFAVVADLGADDTYNQANLTLHTATDVDFFKVVALHNGKLEVVVQFNEVIAPDLAVDVLDAAGNVVAASGVPNTFQPGSSAHMLALPAVQGEHYFVNVYDANAPNTFAPQSTYDLSIVNRAAPTPFGLDLLASSDTGAVDSDNVTSDDTATIQIRADMGDAANMGIDILTPTEIASNEPGYGVAVFVDGLSVGWATPVSGTNSGLWTFTFEGGDLSEGLNSITAKVHVFDPANPQLTGFGAESEALGIVLDMTAPSPPSVPDLLASSDSAGISDDNVTTIISPAFAGTGEANAAVRILADGSVVGHGTIGTDATDGSPGNGLGASEVTVEPLIDGVYDITATAEDLAGNISSPSAALKVTIANQVLYLDGDTADPANTTVVVDLSAGTVAGYPGVAGATGKVGIIGIPAVHLDVNGQALTFNGTAGPDGLTYAPTGAQAGTLARDGSTQTIAFSNVGGTLTIDPLGGSDTVATLGTADVDMVSVLGDTTTTVQVNGLKTVSMPIANTERVVIDTGHSSDSINITAVDTVNANFFVDAGEPTTTKPNGDTLTVLDGSGKAKLRRQPGGPVPNSGSVLVEYDRTTGNSSRIDYVDTENVKLDHTS